MGPGRSPKAPCSSQETPMKLLALLLTAGLLPGLTGQVPDAKNTTARVSAYLNQLEAVGFTGSVIVEINGRNVISHGYGFRNAAEKQRNTPDTIFDIGSITKQFTAAGIL